MIKQYTLFDYIQDDNQDEKNNLSQILQKLKMYIKDGAINQSDTYFNLAIHREPKIVKEKGIYQLKFAQASDSERLLSAYEANNDIKPLELQCRKITQQK